MKPHLQYPALIASLRQRGLSIGSERDAVATLKRIGYYRFSGYLYPLRAFGPSGRSDHFVTGAQFSDAVDRYDFDQRLRSILAEALGVVEVAFPKGIWILPISTRGRVQKLRVFAVPY
jgi:abortive infection bacteriophage resistance protein